MLQSQIFSIFCSPFGRLWLLFWLLVWTALYYGANVAVKSEVVWIGGRFFNRSAAGTADLFLLYGSKDATTVSHPVPVRYIWLIRITATRGCLLRIIVYLGQLCCLAETVGNGRERSRDIYREIHTHAAWQSVTRKIVQRRSGCEPARMGSGATQIEGRSIRVSSLETNSCTSN